MILETIVTGDLGVNCYLLADPFTGDALVIDPGDDSDLILDFIDRRGWRVRTLVATHGHFDHLLACDALRAATGAPLLVHPADATTILRCWPLARSWLGRDPGPPPLADGALNAGSILKLGTISLEVRHTPGHSPGGVVLVAHHDRLAFTGDTLFAGGIGRTDLPGGALAALLASIHREILSLPGDFAVLPGHGPASTVGAERDRNPFLGSGSASYMAPDA
jgi:glyoxylase-like metal-dependent hydrolase (beta-lactamase superfamily II)